MTRCKKQQSPLAGVAVRSTFAGLQSWCIFTQMMAVDVSVFKQMMGLLTCLQGTEHVHSSNCCIQTHVADLLLDHTARFCLWIARLLLSTWQHIHEV